MSEKELKDYFLLLRCKDANKKWLTLEDGVIQWLPTKNVHISKDRIVKSLSLTDEEKRCIAKNISLGFAMQMSDWMPEFFVCIDTCLKLALEKAYEKF